MNTWGLCFRQPQPFERVARFQNELATARYAGHIRDTVLLLQHTPVITLGRRGRTQHLLASPDELRTAGIELHTASRGGDVTYHGPGQWVLYPILRLGALGADAHGYLHNLEEIAIRTCADFGVPAFRVTGKNGAWTPAGKIAAIGFHIKRGITIHGISFNARVSLHGFERIVPCGLAGDPVCSLETLLGAGAPSTGEVGDALLAQFEQVCARPVQRVACDDWGDAQRWWATQSACGQEEGYGA